MTNRDDCLRLDARDPLAAQRALFALEKVDAEGVIYLDGNSLGVLPRSAIERIAGVVDDEWGSGLIRSWNRAGWITLAQRIGDKIATLLGAHSGEVIVADSTSVNLFKALSAAAWAGSRRSRIVSERSNFPTDLYVADTFAREHGKSLVLVDDPSEIVESLDEQTAILMLTHVNYRTGRMHDMRELTRAAHDAGAIVVWDLAHSAGAVPVDLHRSDADFAIGCGYKYLNGGPGAPAFIWAHPRWTKRMDQENWRPPISGWLGHAQPFAFDPYYQPAAGIQRFICGTPPVLSMSALECGVDSVASTSMDLIRAKSLALTDLFIALVEDRLAGRGFTLVTPRERAQRGSQVSFAHAEGGYAITQALIARGVIGDFRAPDILRFGFTPLYTRFVDAWDAADRLVEVMTTGEWREPRFSVRAAVT